jgi:hypothetical protein
MMKSLFPNKYSPPLQILGFNHTIIQKKKEILHLGTDASVCKGSFVLFSNKVSEYRNVHPTSLPFPLSAHENVHLVTLLGGGYKK